VRGVAVRLAHDEIEGQGPLAGLVAGLAASRSDLVNASGCDTPRLRAAFVRRVLEAAEGTAVAIPEALGRLHPLAAAYRREAVLPWARALLEQHRLRPVFLLEGLPHVRVPEAVLRAADPALDSLDNLNTPEDYARAGEAG
jgi:molybdopterin-guanine dinucleotide biosynthesis protein A